MLKKSAVPRAFAAPESDIEMLATLGQAENSANIPTTTGNIDVRSKGLPGFSFAVELEFFPSVEGYEPFAHRRLIYGATPESARDIVRLALEEFQRMYCDPSLRHEPIPEDDYR